jgi:hypothetical protein
MPHNWQLTHSSVPRNRNANHDPPHTFIVSALNHGYKSNFKLEQWIRKCVENKQQSVRYVSNLGAVCALALGGPDTILGCTCITQSSLLLWDTELNASYTDPITKPKLRQM